MFFVAIVAGLIVGLFMYKASLKYTTWGQELVGFLNAIQIKVMNFIYTKVAIKLTDWEN